MDRYTFDPSWLQSNPTNGYILGGVAIAVYIMLIIGAIFSILYVVTSILRPFLWAADQISKGPQARHAERELRAAKRAKARAATKAARAKLFGRSQVRVETYR